MLDAFFHRGDIFGIILMDRTGKYDAVDIISNIRGEAATFIPDSSFKRAFQTQSREDTPHGLTLFSLCYNKTI